MSVQLKESPEPVGAPRNGHPVVNVSMDESGRTIVAMLQKAADMANEDCAKAMDLAHRLSFQLRTAEERATDLEGQMKHYRDRATVAEAWLLRIHDEVEQKFFQRTNPNHASGGQRSEITASR